MQNELLDFQIQIQKYSFDFCEERRDTIIDIMQSVVRKRVGVIGSGAAGLQVAKSMIASGFDCIIVDKSPKIGGVWQSNYR